MKMTMYGRSAGKMDYILSKIPLTYNWIMRKIVSGKVKTILDIGCGTGFPAEIINKDKNYEITGVDVFEPYVEICKRRKIFKEVILQDVRKLSFESKSFDVVICFHLLEHLKRKDARDLIKKMEEIAKKRVALIIPVGNLPQDEYDDNRYQKHLSEWTPGFFRIRGYKVIGQGPKFIYRNANVVQKFKGFSYLLFLVSFLIQPVLMFKPEWATYMFCYKNIK
jgi:ubiquinone/menaquinone biosynthesis C-methylase UbiE